MIIEDFFVLDYEASGLPMMAKGGEETYPIQVGYTDGIIEKCMLIRPMEHWTHWNEVSAKIHKLDRHYVWMKGLTVDEVCHTMNEDLAGKQIWVDSMDCDSEWNRKMFIDANIECKFKFNYYSTEDMAKDNILHDALADAKQIREHIIKMEW